MRSKRAKWLDLPPPASREDQLSHLAASHESLTALHGRCTG